MKNKVYFIICSLLIVLSCKGSRSSYSDIDKSQSTGTNSSDTVVLSKVERDTSVINSSIGIVAESDKFDFGDTVEIFDGKGKKISAFIKSDEYQVLALECLSFDDVCFKVRLENDSIGYIQKRSDKVIFQTWEKHILSVFSVGFDYNANPLLSSYNNKTETLAYVKDEFYFPNEIIGDWLQVKWGDDKKWSYGWIRWKENGRLLIELYYFA